MIRQPNGQPTDIVAKLRSNNFINLRNEQGINCTVLNPAVRKDKVGVAGYQQAEQMLGHSENEYFQLCPFSD